MLTNVINVLLSVKVTFIIFFSIINEKSNKKNMTQNHIIPSYS